MNNITLHGIKIANFRGIGNIPQYAFPFTKFNFLIGPNNSGKSTLLSFIADYLPVAVLPAFSGKKLELKRLDQNINANETLKWSIGIPLDQALEVLTKDNDQLRLNLLQDKVKPILEALSTGGHLWLNRNQKSEITFDSEKTNAEIKAVMPDFNWRNLWQIISGSSGGNVDLWVEQCLRIFAQAIWVQPVASHLIPAKRQISSKGQVFEGWGGQGLIEELAKLQNPDTHERDRLKIFEKINTLVRNVTENESAQIEIPHHREHILVHLDEKVLPLSSLGTGIHELIILAACCTLISGEIVCIEEPELHLHPVLQRRLMHYLQLETNNQYFIATHSAALIDQKGATVLRVSNQAGATTITQAITPNHRYSLLSDLGYRASDILQSNAVIWVEGPSDRVYINHWIRSIAPDLKEGADYSVMFYGGRLLSHLTASDDAELQSDLNSLIAVRNLNRNIVILIDSDKSSKSASVNSTKLRILEEIESHGGICWITAGREIENYVESEVITSALKTVYRRFSSRLKEGHFDHVLPFKTNDGKVFKDVDKMKIANTVCSNYPANTKILDLQSRLETLVDFLRRANL